MKTKLLTALSKKKLYPKFMPVSDRYRFISWRRVLQVTSQPKGSFKISFVARRCTFFQLALVSQWTVVTILGLHSRDGTGRQKDKVYDAFGCFECTQKLGAQSQGACWLSHTVQSLVCNFRCPEIASELVRESSRCLIDFDLLFWLEILNAKVFYRKQLSSLGQQLPNTSENRDTRAIFNASHFTVEFAYVLLCRAICFSKVRFSLAFTVETLSFPPEIQLGIRFTSWKTQIYQFPR